MSVLPRSREAFRFPVELNAWLHAEGPALGPAPARVVNLSRTGAGLRLGQPVPDIGRIDPASPGLDVGRSVRLAVADVVFGCPVSRQWVGRVTHVDREPGEVRRVGVAFDGRQPIAPSVVAAGLSWPLSVLLADPDQQPGSDEGSPVLIPRFDALATAATLLALTADQASKAWAWSAGADLDLVPSLLAVVPSANPGTVAGLAGNVPLTAQLCALVALSMAALAPVGWNDPLPPVSRAGSLVSALGGGLLVAGLVGNATDRLALGHVRDFLVSPACPDWAFNLADVFLVIGAAALLAARLAPRPESPRAERA